MNSGLPSLLDAIFGKENLASVSLDELYELINEFPSFNAGHFLLSKKLKDQDHAAFEKESMRTSLYFHNAFWLQTLFAEDDDAETPVYERENEPLIAEETIIPSAPETFEETRDEPFEENRVMSFDDLMSKYNIQTNEPNTTIAEGPAEEIIESTTAGSVENIIEEPAEETLVEIATESLAPIDTPTDNSDSIEHEPAHWTQVSAEENEEPYHIAKEEKEEPDNGSPVENPETEYSGEIINEYGIFEEAVEKNHDYDLDAFDKPIDNVPSHVESENSELIKTNEENHSSEMEEITPVISDESDYEAFDRVPNQEPEQKPVIHFDAKNAESIVFAPYHMVDYFASQGIKLVLEDQPADHFGKQLKSFTDWLKVMKKVPVSALSEKADEKEAERIRHFAAHSIEGRDVLTESMAEVLAKQGMYENAIALYQKLSLIYPPKSAYFASRIEQLKAALP